MDSYVLFRKDRPARRDGRVAFYVSRQLECFEICLRMSDEWAKSLWMRSEEQTNMGDITVGVYYRLPD